MYDTGDRKDIRKAEKQVAIAERSRIEFLRLSLSTEAGRRWFHDLLATCHLFADPFTGNALIEAYNKGERNVGLRIFADIQTHAPDQYILMMREASIRSTTNGRRTDDNDNRSSSDEHGSSSDERRDVEGSDPDFDHDTDGRQYDHK